MRDGAVEARLVAAFGIVALVAGVRAVQMQFGVGERRARLASDDFQAIRGTRRIARSHHRAGYLDRRARRRFQEDRRYRLAGHIGNCARAARRDYAQLAAEIAHDVEMVDQHFGNHQPLLELCVGFAHEQGATAARVGQQSGRHRSHAREDELPQLARSNPALQLAIPRPEPPVLVRHQP